MNSEEFSRRSREGEASALALAREVEVEKTFDKLGVLFEKTLGNKRLKDMWTNLKFDTLGGTKPKSEQWIMLFRRMRDAVNADLTVVMFVRRKALEPLDEAIARLDPTRPPASA